MSFVAVIILRKREPNMERPYKVPLYPIIPLIAILAGSFVLINTLFTIYIGNYWDSNHNTWDTSLLL